MQSEAAKLIRELFHPIAGWKASHREQLADSLVALGPAAVPQMVAALWKWSARNRFSAAFSITAAECLARALGRIGDPAAREVLEHTLLGTAADADQRKTAREALRHALGASGIRLGRPAIEALGELGDRQAVPCLIRLADDARQLLDNRNAAVLALCRLADDRDAEALTSALWAVLAEPGDGSYDQDLRSAARDAVIKRLIGLRSPGAIPALLAQPLCTQVSPEALAAVGVLGIPALVAGLDPNARFRIGWNRELPQDAGLALRALMRLGSAAMPHLWEFVGETPSAISSRCAIALCALGAVDDRLIGPVVQALQHSWSTDFAIIAFDQLVSRSNNPALRSGLPMLQRLATGIRLDGEGRARCQALVQRIEALTGGVSVMPIASRPPQVRPGTLPVTVPEPPREPR